MYSWFRPSRRILFSFTLNFLWCKKHISFSRWRRRINLPGSIGNCLSWKQAKSVRIIRGLMTFLIGGLYFISVILVVSLALAILGLVIGKKVVSNREKLTSFECGFDPLRSARRNFSLRFFLLAIVFLIFDLEIALLVPYFYSLSLGISFLARFFCFLFVVVLFLGLVHEFNEGTLRWFDA